MEFFGHFTIFFLQGVGGGGLQAAALGEENGEETPAWVQGFNIAQIAQQGCHSSTALFGYEFVLRICLSLLSTTGWPFWTVTTSH